MERLHVCVQLVCMHKGSSAVAVLANQFWCPVSTAEVVFKPRFTAKLFPTFLLQAIERFLVQVHSPHVYRQGAKGGKIRSTLGVVAPQLLLPVSCRTLVNLQVLLSPKYLLAVASLALVSLLGKVNLSHVYAETIL